MDYFKFASELARGLKVQATNDGWQCVECDAEFLERPAWGKCTKAIDGVDLCGGHVKEILPCAYCGILEYQCKCEPERYEER